MSKTLEIRVTSPFRCRGKLRNQKTLLIVGEDVTKAEARSLIGQKKAEWVTEEKTTKATANKGKQGAKKEDDTSDDAGGDNTGGGDE
ncbi:hypothetical protein V8066_004525 [Vibrio parahaemolyticus]